MDKFNELLEKTLSCLSEGETNEEIITEMVESYRSDDIEKLEAIGQFIYLESDTQNLSSEVFSVFESLKDKIHEKIRQVKDDAFIAKSNYTPVKAKTVEKENISDDEFAKIKKWFSDMREASTFKKYKKIYNEVCQYFGIPKEGSIISSYKFTDGKKENQNSVVIRFSSTPKKIKIPNGSVLYHTSPVNNIKELKPNFKGKDAKGYLCSSPRIYFTINKPASNIFVDLKSKTNTFKYVPEENITTAFLDPLLSLYTKNAVYVETNYPIKVKPIEGYYKLTESEETETPMEEEVKEHFSSLEEFMEYFGLEFAEDDDTLVQESFAAMIGKHKREKESKNEIRKAWDSIVDTTIKHKNIEKETDKDTFNLLKDAHKTISDTEKYSEYKKAYEYICKFFSADPKETIIHHIIFTDKNDKYKVRMIFGYGRKKIILPAGTQLIHVTPADKLPHLTPTFRSKTKGSYLYPNKRVFFTVSKEIKGKQCGLEHAKQRHVYTPKEVVKTAWVDQSYPSYAVGAVYIQTDGNIPVTQLK